jgi:hypothetical protein
MTESGIWNWIDFSGARVAEPQFPDDGAVRLRIMPFDEPRDGKLIVHPSRYTRFRDGLCRVKANGKWGYVGTRCQIVVRPRFAQAEDFSSGMAAVGDGNGKWGYIDKTGEVAIPMQFENARKFYRADPELSLPV